MLSVAGTVALGLGVFALASRFAEGVSAPDLAAMATLGLRVLLVGATLWALLADWFAARRAAWWVETLRQCGVEEDCSTVGVVDP